MTGKRLVAFTLGLLCAAPLGCVSFNNRGFEQALHTPNPAPVPMPARGRVHVFVMNGLDVTETGRITALRDRLVDAGFAKVYVAQRPDREWYYRELRRVMADEPEARLVLVGYGAASAPVYNLAYEAVRDKLPLDALILLDPVGLNGDLAAGLKTHSIVVRSHNWRGGVGLTAREEIAVPGVGHPSLPTHIATVEVITRVLTASASGAGLEPHDLLPFLPLTDTPDPTPRPFVRPPAKPTEPVLDGRNPPSAEIGRRE